LLAENVANENVAHVTSLTNKGYFHCVKDTEKLILRCFLLAENAAHENVAHGNVADVTSRTRKGYLHCTKHTDRITVVESCPDI